MGTNITWTAEHENTLRNLWEKEGLTARQISAQMNGIYTRNAIISKVHRMGLSGRPSKVSFPKKKRESYPQVSKKRNKINKFLGAISMKEAPEPILTLPAPEPVNGTGLSFLQLTNGTCKYALGKPGAKPEFFCGNPTKDEGPFCSYHHRVCYRPIKVKLNPTIAA